MNRIFIGIISALFFFSKIEASIEQIGRLASIEQSTDKDSLVLFNITNTLYTSSTTMGDSLWKNYFIQRVHHNVSEPAHAEKIINQVKNRLVHAVPKELVEKDIPTIIGGMQAKGIPALGFTAKHPSHPYESEFGELVDSFLSSLDIHFENSQEFLAIQPDLDDEFHQYFHGIIFTSGKPKNTAIASFLNRLAQKPRSIVMVDTNRKGLEEVEEVLSNTGIAFFGFHYKNSNIRQNHFEAALGTIQFEEFLRSGKVISDQEAALIREQNPQPDYEELLNNLIRSIAK